MNSPVKRKKKLKKPVVTLEQLVIQMRGALIISIGDGQFNNTCWLWANTLVQYGQTQCTRPHRKNPK